MAAARVERLLAVALCAWATAAGAAQIDTLFHTPEERERLDRLRRGEPVAQARAEASGRRELTGYVKRSDGRGTAFIDGVPVPVDRRAAPMLEPGAVSAYAPRESEDFKVERKPKR